MKDLVKQLIIDNNKKIALFNKRIISVYNTNTENGRKILMVENVNFENNQLWFFVKYGEYICIRYKKDCQKVIDIPNGNLSNWNE